MQDHITYVTYNTQLANKVSAVETGRSSCLASRKRYRRRDTACGDLYSVRTSLRLSLDLRLEFYALLPDVIVFQLDCSGHFQECLGASGQE